MCPACAVAIAQLVVAATSATGSATVLIVKIARKNNQLAPVNEGTHTDGGDQ
jgi:hypothetical protein